MKLLLELFEAFILPLRTWWRAVTLPLKWGAEGRCTGCGGKRDRPSEPMCDDCYAGWQW